MITTLVRKTIKTGILALLLLGLIFPLPVFADDGTAGEDPSPIEEGMEGEPVTETVALPDPGSIPDEVDLVIVDQGGEPLPMASTQAAEVLKAPDPYLTSGGVLYSFTADDCDPLTEGAQACANPIQSAINFVGNGYTPDDGTVYVESGSYNENLTLTSLSNFHLVGVSGSSSTVLTGSVNISDSTNISLQGFTIYGSIYADDNTGVMNLEDLIVDGNEEGTGIRIFDQIGEIKINNVHSKNSFSNGLSIANFIGGVPDDQNLVQGEIGSKVYIWNSSFNDNHGNGILINRPGSISLYNVQANWNGKTGASIMNNLFLNESSNFPLLFPENFSNVVVKKSEFIGNGINLQLEGIQNEPGELFSNGNGLFVISDQIFVKGTIASNNSNNGMLLLSSSELPQQSEEEQVPTKIKVVCSKLNDNGNYGVAGETDGNIVHKNVTTQGNGAGGVNYTFYNSFLDNADFICTKQVVEDEEFITDENKIPCNPQGLTLRLEDQNIARFTGFCEHEGHLIAVEPSSLPGALPEGFQPGSALEVGAYLNNNLEPVLPAGGSIQVEFFVPAEFEGKELVILYWDSGKNEWIEIPLGGNEGAFAPSDPAKQVLSGAAQLANGNYGFSVNFSGIFVLVTR